MANVEIVLNDAGVRELLKSAEISAICEAKAAKMTRATGMDYVVDVYVGKTRVNAAGWKKADKEDNQSRICPKCGRWHPNCKCSTQTE